MPDCEIIELWLKPNCKPDYLHNKCLVGVVFCIKQDDYYIGLLAGIDYAYQHQQVYRQLLYAITQRARENKIKTVHFGFGASLEKKRVGAESVDNFVYLKQKSLFSNDAMQEMSAVDRV